MGLGSFKRCVMQVQETNYLRDITIVNRVCIGPEKPGKSQNFLLTFSRTGESQKKTSGTGKS